MSRGALVVVEGLDRAGKTTQCDRLVARLSTSTTTKLRKFPDRTTPIGIMIDSYLRSNSDLDDNAIHLLFSANRWEASSAIKAELENGTTLVVDRYIYSGIAFSRAKGLDAAWCRNPDVGLPRPDVVIFLDISEEATAGRGGYGEERYEKKEMQRKVRQAFKELRQDERDAEDWVVVDAGQSVEEVEEDIWRAAQKGIERAKTEDLRTIL
ncbi:deoxythymidylate kinase-like protein [Saitoella complicata NRRL Y-17804]|uniref:Thymidylate kinase n=1 Tax=Saitoella complicata (strain BCRC 22490 / CBS 7301 / JCM 7358 / NBRC 10748 / NRRL Y-17804) TaxID=698492 RepID=A0A0E9NH32_SAICN|nr:deoxythymidylate kinase-like protein [Saitoella complicata NRRL Y-17804]ODQ54044.1 deoxythymidylate kinase-like protein [Saitoella complicata NRRL Y-17804]GAO49118.1 hypothetical protein G7K_3276-t1 [Saitoella complicata NRRL Y-17804]